MTKKATSPKSTSAAKKPASPPPKGNSSVAQDDPKVAARAAELTDYGTVERVPFKLLRSNDNIRQIRDKADQTALNASVATGKAQERMVGHRCADGTIALESGSRRHIALGAAGYPGDALIEVVIRPTPKSLAEDRIRGLKANERSDIAWPDKARAIGQITGVIDARGLRLSKAALEEARGKGDVLSHKDAAVAVSLGLQGLEHYVRAAHAPYGDLVRIFEHGGSLAHGEEYGKYWMDPNRTVDQNAEVLAHYLRHHSFPVDVPPPRQRAAGGGRPINPDAARPGNKRKPPPAASPAVWDPGLDKAEKAAAPEADKAAQTSMFETPPAKGSVTAGPVAAAPEAGVREVSPSQNRARVTRPEGQLEEICDHYGISLEAGELFDEIAVYWGSGKIEDWGTICSDAVEKAVGVYKAYKARAADSEDIL